MKNKTLLVKMMRLVACVLVLTMLFVTGCGKKVNKKTPTDSKQEESKEEADDDKDLPILSNDGEELVIDEADEKTSTDSDKNTDSSATDSNKTEKESESDSKNTVENEPEQDTNNDVENEPEQDSDDEKEENNKPVELPFVPADKLKK